MRLEDIPNGRIEENERGTFLSVKRYERENSDELPEKIREYINYLIEKRSGKLESLFPKYKVDEAVFFDIETTGFNPNNQVFMIGYSYLRETLNTRVLVARDPYEEGAILWEFFSFLKEKENPLVISYNGQSFDVPRLLNRSKYHGISFGNGENSKLMNGNHSDLYLLMKTLQSSHRITLNLPKRGGRTLSSVELNVFKFNRKSDISGSKVPEVYHAYLYGETNSEKKVSEKKAIEDMIGVINHIDQDILTPVALLGYFSKHVKN